LTAAVFPFGDWRTRFNSVQAESSRNEKLRAKPLRKAGVADGQTELFDGEVGAVEKKSSARLTNFFKLRCRLLPIARLSGTPAKNRLRFGSAFWSGKIIILELWEKFMFLTSLSKAVCNFRYLS